MNRSFLDWMLCLDFFGLARIQVSMSSTFLTSESESLRTSMMSTGALLEKADFDGPSSLRDLRSKTLRCKRADSRSSLCDVRMFLCILHEYEVARLLDS